MDFYLGADHAGAARGEAVFRARWPADENRRGFPRVRPPLAVTDIDHNVDRPPASDSPGPAPPQPDHTAATSVTLARAARRVSQRSPRSTATGARAAVCPAHATLYAAPAAGAGSEPGGVWRSAEETMGSRGGSWMHAARVAWREVALMFPMRLIAFRVGVREAKVLSDEFFPEFSVEDLVNLPQFQIYLRLMIDGVVSRGFSAATLPRSSLP